MLTAETNFLNASSRINLVYYQNTNLIVKFTFSIVLILSFLTSCESGKVEKYKKKEEKVEFSHSIHAKNNIDCKYCHNQEKSSEKTETICLDCHKQIKAK